MTHFPKANYYDTLVLDLHINEKNLCLFPSNRGYKYLSYAVEEYHVICAGGFLMTEWQILVV